MDNTIFKKIDSLVSDEVEIPATSGVYIVVLREGAYLPTDVIRQYPQYTNFTWNKKGFEVVYVGKSKDLRTRDYKQHFNGSAGSSTLRKSLGCLMGFTLIPRDSNTQSRRTTLNQKDEQKVSTWMKKNLLFFYCPTDNQDKMEKTLIAEFNPPLNLKDNHSQVNNQYRKQLSKIRNTHVDDSPYFANTVCPNCGLIITLGEEAKNWEYIKCNRCKFTFQSPYYYCKQEKKDTRKAYGGLAIILLFVIIFIVALIQGVGSKGEVIGPDGPSVSDARFNVILYLRTIGLKDPDSYEGISWEPYGKYNSERNTYYMVHEYRAKNSFGGYVVESRVFVLNKEGKVINVVTSLEQMIDGD